MAYTVSKVGAAIRIVENSESIIDIPVGNISMVRGYKVDNRPPFQEAAANVSPKFVVEICSEKCCYQIFLGGNTADSPAKVTTPVDWTNNIAGMTNALNAINGWISTP